MLVDVFAQLANATVSPPARTKVLAIQIQTLYFLALTRRMPWL
jgi:hypothetical protein